MITIALGTDHRGFALKQFLLQQKKTHNGNEIVWIDVGCQTAAYCDYPEFAKKVCSHILSGAAGAGILLCGTGIGMAIAANRLRGIYAGLVWNEEVARLAKEHDKVNVLVLPADYLTPQQMLGMVDAWLSASFLGGKYEKRIAMIDEISTK